MAADRVEIPLRMLRGNLEVLLEGPIRCNTIALKHDPDSNDGVILMIAMNDEQKAEARERGFSTTPYTGPDDD